MIRDAAPATVQAEPFATAANPRGRALDAVLTGVATLVLALLAFRMTFLFGPNSDIWFVLAFARDLRLGIPISGWSFPPPAFLFPEIIPGVIAALFFQSSVAIAIHAAGIVLATALLLWLIARRLSTDNRAPLGPIVATLLLLVAVLLPIPRPNMLTMMLWPFIHYSSIVTACILLAVTIPKLTVSPILRDFCVTSACYFLLVSGDILSLEQFVAPMFATLALFAIARVIKPAVPGFHFAAFIAAFVAFSLVKAAGHRFFAFDFPKATNWLPDLGRLGRNLIEAWRTFRPVMADYWILLLIGAAWLLVSFRIIRRFARAYLPRAHAEPSKAEVSILFFVVFAIAVFGTSIVVPILYGNASEAAYIRYFIPVLVLPSFVLAVLFAADRRRFHPRIGRGLVCIGLIASLFSIWRFQLWQIDGQTLSAPWEYQAIAGLDEACKARNVRYGYNYYWFCKIVSVGSSQGVCPQQVTPDFSPFVHIENKRWYANPDGSFTPSEYPAYSFAIVGVYSGPGFTRESIAERFGPAAAEVQVHPNVRVLFYDRPQDVAFRNYLRAPAAALMKNRVMSSRVTPGAIERFTPDVSASAVLVAPQLDVRFDPPAAGNVLELTCNPEAELAVTAFDATDQRLWRVESGPSLNASNTRRFISLPIGGDGEERQASPKPIARLLIESPRSAARVAYASVYFDTGRFK